MTYERLAYDDQDSTTQMHLDCAACATQMGIPARRISPEDLERADRNKKDRLRAGQRLKPRSGDLLKSKRHQPQAREVSPRFRPE